MKVKIYIEREFFVNVEQGQSVEEAIRDTIAEDMDIIFDGDIDYTIVNTEGWNF